MALIVGEAPVEQYQIAYEILHSWIRVAGSRLNGMNRQSLGPMRRSRLPPCPMRNARHRRCGLRPSAYPGDSEGRHSWRRSAHVSGYRRGDAGRDRRTSTHDPRLLRHSNLHVTNKCLQATPENKRLAQGKLVEAILPGCLLSVNISTLIQ